MNKMLKTSYTKWLCAKVFMAIFFLVNFILITQSAEAVKFRLPLSSDTSFHYYYDNDSSSGILDWKCGTATYNGHRGTDFSGGPRGRSIYAAADGTLDYKIDGFGDGYLGNTDGGGFGNYVRLNHSNGLMTYYGHMTSGSVTTKSLGSNISCSEQIGGVGTSGNSSGLHLHFEPRLNWVGFDPYAGSCSVSTSWWVDQGTGSPSITCENTSPKFNIGDTVEVFGTSGSGLKAWTDICTGTYIVKPDGAIGTILQGPQSCDGYNRWKIRWAADLSERWSAEDWLRKTSSASFGGIVTDATTGSTISGASVVWGSYTKTTDGSGSYRFDFVPCQTNTLTVSKVGYQTFSQSHTPPCNQSSVKNVALTPNCTYTISPTSRLHGSGSETGSVGVTVSSGSCSWTATSNATWITITSGSSGTGNGMVYYSVSANTGTSLRTGTMTIAGQTFNVTQEGVCVYTISPTNKSFSSDAGTGSVAVTTSSGCSWTAASYATWITITSGSSGTGNGMVYYSVSANTGTSLRTGTMTIAGQTFNVTQEGVCVYTISPTNKSFSSDAGTGSVALTTSSGCSWTAASYATWITITSGSSGTGNGMVYYSVSANTGTSLRTGTMTIAGQTFNVTQEGVCVYTISPTNKSFSSDAGTGSVAVTTTSGCSWTATSNASWITVTSGSSGTGNGTVYYSVSTNTGTSQRTGTLTIADQTFTVYQAGAGQCTVTSFKINNGAVKTRSYTVALNNTATGSPTHYMASEYQNFGDASWQVYSAAPYFTLRSGPGKTRTVYFKVKNISGESSVVQDSIKIKFR